MLRAICCLPTSLCSTGPDYYQNVLWKEKRGEVGSLRLATLPAPVRRPEMGSSVSSLVPAKLVAGGSDARCTRLAASMHVCSAAGLPTSRGVPVILQATQAPGHHWSQALPLQQHARRGIDPPRSRLYCRVVPSATDSSATPTVQSLLASFSSILAAVLDIRTNSMSCRLASEAPSDRREPSALRCVALSSDICCDCSIASTSAGGGLLTAGR